MKTKEVILNRGVDGYGKHGFDAFTMIPFTRVGIYLYFDPSRRHWQRIIKVGYFVRPAR